MCLEAGFDKLAEAVTAIVMFARRFDEIDDVYMVATARTICSAWRRFDSNHRCRLFHCLITTNPCCGRSGLESDRIESGIDLKLLPLDADDSLIDGAQSLEGVQVMELKCDSKLGGRVVHR